MAAAVSEVVAVEVAVGQEDEAAEARAVVSKVERPWSLSHIVMKVCSLHAAKKMLWSPAI